VFFVILLILVVVWYVLLSTLDRKYWHLTPGQHVAAFLVGCLFLGLVL
jgi:hypothetical protein